MGIAAKTWRPRDLGRGRGADAGVRAPPSGVMAHTFRVNFVYALRRSRTIRIFQDGRFIEENRDNWPRG